MDALIGEDDRQLDALRQSLKAQIRSAAKLAAEALTDVLPAGLQGREERQQLRAELDAMYEEALQSSTLQMQQATEAQLQEDFNNAKHRLFQAMIARVRTHISHEIPEAGTALFRLQQAHLNLFIGPGTVRVVWGVGFCLRFSDSVVFTAPPLRPPFRTQRLFVSPLTPLPA